MKLEDMNYLFSIYKTTVVFSSYIFEKINMNETLRKIVLKPFISRKQNVKGKWTKYWKNSNLMSKSLAVNSVTRNLDSVKKVNNLFSKQQCFEI